MQYSITYTGQNKTEELIARLSDPNDTDLFEKWEGIFVEDE